ncbi:MAG: phosphoribosyltransferase family protein [Patescibacteria group bacterium]|jgi:predicted phosphoribosyltransferase
MPFADRNAAGFLLATSLEEYKDKPVVVFALPRGGVALGKIVAQHLHAPLDLLIPRKIGHPDNPEYAIASVSEKGKVIKNELEVSRIDPAWFEAEVERQRGEAARRRVKYLADRTPVDVKGKTAIIVDDGIATGLTMKAAIDEARAKEPSAVVLAVPVAPRDTIRELEKLVDRLIVLKRPLQFQGSIGFYYKNFSQVSDEEVIEMMSDLAL